MATNFRIHVSRSICHILHDEPVRLLVVQLQIGSLLTPVKERMFHLPQLETATAPHDVRR